jgi:uncharacterized protein YjbI with pentapeptide repeats
MTELLLNKHLRSSQPDAEVRNMARARTLTVLPQLDARRQGNLIDFLSESKLLGIISLSEADLSGANLRHANLSGANLKGALGITIEELEKQARSLQGATMPDGSIHP